MSEMKTVTIGGVTYTVHDPDALSGTDTTLSVSNKAADAAAAGAALAGKLQSVTVPDRGNVLNFRIDAWGSSAKRTPLTVFLSGQGGQTAILQMVIDCTDGSLVSGVCKMVGGSSYITHSFYRSTTGTSTSYSLGNDYGSMWGQGMFLYPADALFHVENNGSDSVTSDAGTYIPVEWSDPPMVLGVEYRTTERYKGKVVYTMLADLGTLPNSDQKIVMFSSESTKVIRCEGHTGDGGSIPSYAYGNRVDITGNTTSIIVNTTYDVSAYTATAQVWYLKD